MGKTIRGSFIGTSVGKKSRLWECLCVHRKQYVDDIKMTGKKQNMAPMWKKLMKKRWSGRTNIISFLTVNIWDVLNVNANRTISPLTEMQRCLNHVFLLEQLKNYRGGKSLTQKPCRGSTTWKDMLRNALRDTVNWQTRKWNNCTKFQAFVWRIIISSKREFESVEELSEVCSHIVLKCWYLARIGRPDVLWSVDKLARSVTKWTQACDRRLARLISYIHRTNDFQQYCHVGNTAQHCRLGLFQDSDFSGVLQDSQSTSGGVLCIFGSRTFVIIRWMCKKQTSVSHSSSESEIISLDAGLRMDGTLALDLWDVVIEALRTTNDTAKQSKTSPRKLVHDRRPFHQQTRPKHQLTKESKRLINCLMWIAYPPTQFLLKVSLSCTFLEDNDAVIKNDYQTTKSNDETRVQNPQSCAWLVVRQHQSRTQDPNQICWHQKPTRRHANQRKFEWRMESSSSFVQHYEFFDVLL